MLSLNLPNKLTLGRIAMVPFVLVLLWLGGRWCCLLATVFFGIASFTDLMDGYLARRDNQVTTLGKFLDPLADKVLITSVLIMLTGLGWINPWPAIIIIARDLMVTGLRGIAADAGIVIAADTYGKAKTVMQIVALIPLMIHYSWFGLPLDALGQFLLYIALALTVFSGWNYFRNFFREQRVADKQPILSKEEK